MDLGILYVYIYMCIFIFIFDATRDCPGDLDLPRIT